MVSSVAGVEAVDDLTVKITTNVPNPALMEDIGRVFIISKAAAEGKSSEDFNAPWAPAPTCWTNGASARL